MSLKEKLISLRSWASRGVSKASEVIVNDLIEFLDDNKPAQEFLKNLQNKKLEWNMKSEAIAPPTDNPLYIHFNYGKTNYRVGVEDNGQIEMWMPAIVGSKPKAYNWYSSPLSAMSVGLQKAATLARAEAIKKLENKEKAPDAGGLQYVVVKFKDNYYRTSINAHAGWIDIWENNGWVCGTLSQRIKEMPELEALIKQARIEGDAKLAAEDKKKKETPVVINSPRLHEIYDEDEGDEGLGIFDEDDEAAMDALEAQINKDRKAETALDVEAPKTDHAAIAEAIKAKLAANAADKAERAANEDKFTEKQKIDFTSAGPEWIIFEFEGSYYKINKNQSINRAPANYLDVYEPNAVRKYSGQTVWSYGTYGLPGEKNPKLIEAAEMARHNGGLKIPKPKYEQNNTSVLVKSEPVTKVIPPYRPGSYNPTWNKSPDPTPAKAPSTNYHDADNYVEFVHDNKHWKIHKKSNWIDEWTGHHWTYRAYNAVSEEVIKAGEAELAKHGIIRNSEVPTVDDDYVMFTYLNRQFRISFKYSSSIYEWVKKDRSWAYFAGAKDTAVSSKMIDEANAALIAAGKPPVEGTYRAKAREELTGDNLDCFDIGDETETEINDEVIGSLKDKVIKKKSTTSSGTETQVWIQGHGWVKKSEAARKHWDNEEWYRNDYY